MKRNINSLVYGISLRVHFRQALLSAERTTRRLVAAGMTYATTYCLFFFVTCAVPAEYGAGEEIDVTVSFDYPVAVTAEAHILLDVGDGRLPGEAMYLYGNRTSAVTFLYTVQDGDHSVDLGTYEGGATGGGGGLRGTVLRDSDTPTQVLHANTSPLFVHEGATDRNLKSPLDGFLELFDRCYWHRHLTCFSSITTVSPSEH